MIRLFKQAICKHEWKLYRVNSAKFASLRGEERVYACPKCGKIKRGSGHLAEYEGRGYK